MAGYAKGVPGWIGITPALSLLYGHCPTVLLYILHHFNGFGASQGSSLREWWTWMIRLLPVILSQSGCFFRRQGVVTHYSNVTDARIAVQEGKNLQDSSTSPKGLSAEAQSQRQPKISFYTNYSYLIAGSLLFRDMKMMGRNSPPVPPHERALLPKVQRRIRLWDYLQPIVIDTHPLNNPWLNYSVYLCNTLIPEYLCCLYSWLPFIQSVWKSRTVLHVNGYV